MDEREIESIRDELSQTNNITDLSPQIIPFLQDFCNDSKAKEDSYFLALLKLGIERLISRYNAMYKLAQLDDVYSPTKILTQPFGYDSLLKMHELAEYDKEGRPVKWKDTVVGIVISPWNIFFFLDSSKLQDSEKQLKFLGLHYIGTPFNLILCDPKDKDNKSEFFYEIAKKEVEVPNVVNNHVIAPPNTILHETIHSFADFFYEAFHHPNHIGNLITLLNNLRRLEKIKASNFIIENQQKMIESLKRQLANPHTYGEVFKEEIIARLPDLISPSPASIRFAPGKALYYTLYEGEGVLISFITDALTKIRNLVEKSKQDDKMQISDILGNIFTEEFYRKIVQTLKDATEYVALSALIERISQDEDLENTTLILSILLPVRKWRRLVDYWEKYHPELAQAGRVLYYIRHAGRLPSSSELRQLIDWIKRGTLGKQGLLVLEKILNSNIYIPLAELGENAFELNRFKEYMDLIKELSNYLEGLKIDEFTSSYFYSLLTTFWMQPEVLLNLSKMIVTLTPQEKRILASNITLFINNYLEEELEKAAQIENWDERAKGVLREKVKKALEQVLSTLQASYKK